MAPISDIQRQTFTDIYRTYFGKLYGVCLHYVHDHDIASDLLHDSFIVIFSSLDQLRDHSKLEPWMCSIVRNIALKHLRDSQRMPETSLETIPEPVFEETSVHVSEIPLAELLKVIDDLPEQYGKVFRLSVLDGLSHKEIGEIMGIAAHSSSSNLARAKQMLRKVVSKNWGILLTFCLCISAILFSINTEDETPVISDITRTDISQADNHEIMISELIRAKNLPPMEYRIADTPASYGPDAAFEPETDEETVDEKKPTEHKRPSETYSPDDTGNIDGWELYETTAPERIRRQGTLSFGFGGNIGNSATGTSFTGHHDSGTGTTSPPYTGDDFTGCVPGGNLGSDITDGLTPPEVNEPVTPDINDEKTPSYLESYRHSMPVSFTASIKWSFAERWALISGVGYTYLHSEISEISGTMKYRQDIHYLGIPIKLSWTVWSSRSFSAYASAGATFEFPLAGYRAGKRMDVPCQWSAGLGIGIQYDITPHLGIYIEPEYYRYFDNGSTVKTIRTESPVSVNVPIGIRFSW